MLSVTNLSKQYDFTVLKDITIEFPGQGFVALKGESGSGKSTLLKCIGLLEDPTRGEICYGDQNLTAFGAIKREQVRGRIFAYIPQVIALSEDETVEKNLAYFCSDADQIQQVLTRLGIADKASETARNLSGGERQLVALAQALLREAPVLLCDEITANLDEQNAERVLQILKEFSVDRLVVCVGHNAAQMQKYADRVITLADGVVAQDIRYSAQQAEHSQTSQYARPVSLGIKQYFRIFCSHFSAKLARILFCVIFAWVALSGFCFGITQVLTGTDGLIRKQADLLGVDFVKVQVPQEDCYLAMNTQMANSWFVFVDFEQEKEHFKLVQGDYPTNEREILISEYAAKYDGLKVGDTVMPNVKLTYRVSGIFACDLSAYPEKLQEDYVPYATLSAYYLPASAQTAYEEAVGFVTDYTQNTYVASYLDQEVLAGRMPAAKDEVLVTSGFLASRYGMNEAEIRSDAREVFDQIEKQITFNGHELTIVGLCMHENTAYLSTQAFLYLAEDAGYVCAVSETDRDNFYPFDFVSAEIGYYQNWVKVGMSLFAVFAVLAGVMFLNLHLYEIDEKKTLFHAMWQAGFSVHALAVYLLVADLMVLCLATVVFLTVSVPIFAHFEVVEMAGLPTYIYGFHPLSVLLSVLVLGALVCGIWVATYRKWNGEIRTCSK